MRPNLKAAYVKRLSFSTNISLIGEKLEKIRELAKPDDDGNSVFFDKYQGHRSVLIIRETNKELQEYEFEYFCHARGGTRLPSYLPSIEDFCQILPIKDKINFTCSVLFDFRKSLKMKTIIPLPLKYIDSPDVPFDRIQGVHLAKAENGVNKYDVILDTGEKGAIMEHVSFQYSSHFDGKLPTSILNEAIEISKKLVFKRKIDA